MDQVKGELVATHRRLLAFLSDIPERDSATERRLLRRIRLDTYSHYREHTAQIAAWRRPLKGSGG